MTQAAQVQAPEGPVEASPEPSPLVERVLRPMFASRTVAEFEAGLEDWLHEGAVLHFRMAASNGPKAVDVPALMDDEAVGVVADELDHRAAACLSPERSFKVRRALEQILVSGLPMQRKVVGALQAATWDLTTIRDLARLSEVSVAATILAIGWTMVLTEQLPTPTSEVADAASTVFLQATARALATQSGWLSGDWTPVAVEFRELVSAAWIEAHPRIALAMVFWLGHVLNDPETVGVELEVIHDPEDRDLDVLRILVRSSGDPDDALDRIDRASLTTGVMGASVDPTGAAVVVIMDRAASA
jgi:hypothetical protein